MKLSVIIPVYNAEKYLSECLDSALRQNFSEDEYEIICVDDCSTDNSGRILNEYASGYKAIVHLTNEKNSGVSVTRNNGLKAARGKYITFLDADDMIADNVYPRIVDELERSHLTVATWCGGCHYGVSFQPDVKYLKFEHVAAESLLDKVNTVWRLLFEKRIIDEYRLTFAAGVSYAEDALFSYLMFLARKDNTVLSTEQHLYFYRIVNGSLSKVRQDTCRWYEKLAENMKRLALWLSAYIEDNSERYDSRQKEKIEERMHRYSARAIYNAARSQTNILKNAVNELKESDMYPYKLSYVLRPITIGGVLRPA